MMLTAKQLHELLTYDPATGFWYWRVRRRGVPRDLVAGRTNTDGYREIYIKGRAYQASRLAFLYMTGEWPPHEVDHIDRNPSNNAWTNLRLATRSENACNRGPLGISGFKGVHLNRGTWVAQISINGRYLHLGSFITKEEAAAAYAAKAKELHGEFAYEPHPFEPIDLKELGFL